MSPTLIAALAALAGAVAYAFWPRRRRPPEPSPLLPPAFAPLQTYTPPPASGESIVEMIERLRRIEAGRILEHRIGTHEGNKLANELSIAIRPDQPTPAPPQGG